MVLLGLGLIAFFGIHLVPAVPSLHASLTARLGVHGRKGFIALVAAAGFTLLVVGWQRAGFVPVYTPPSFGHWLPRVLMLPALILLAMAYVPSNVRRVTRHPMLWGTVLWSLAHLFANGDLRSLLLFGSFLAWALFDMWSANRRGAFLSEQRVPWYYEAASVAAGLLAYVLLAFFHRDLFGAAVLSAR